MRGVRGRLSAAIEPSTAALGFPGSLLWGFDGQTDHPPRDEGRPALGCDVGRVSSSTSTPTVARLVDPAGTDRAATPREVASQLEEGGFFWLDLESPSDDELVEFYASLRLPASITGTVVQSSPRSAFALRAHSAQAVLPAAVDTEAAAWLEANYVTAVLTERFLFTVHAAPCAPLQHAREHYLALDDEDIKADQARTLFLVLDILLDSFRSQLLKLDDRLGEIQLGMLDGATPKVHDELVQILGILTDGIQEFGWYVHDLDAIAESVDPMPGTRSSTQEHSARHRQRVTRLRKNGKEIREEAKDALRQYSELVAGRQAQVLGSLTVVATVFLPLSFLTGYFGMNFRILTADVQTKLWQFLLLGLLLPIASAALSLLLIDRLERRFGIGRMGRRPS